MTMSALERLEFAVIRSALLERTRTPLGALEIQAWAPLARPEEARARIEAIRQARGLHVRHETPPVEGAHDVRAALTLGEKGVMLEGPALRALAETMRAGSALRRHLLAHEADAPVFYGMAASLTDLSRVANEVLKSFDPDGQLADEASLELGPLRRKVRSLRDAIKDQISVLLHAAEMQPYLQESYFTVRADRYVLPIKAQYKNEVKGIVHDASGSGQTVFIEPAVVVDLGNRLKIAQSEQVEEEHRILSRLTVRVVAEGEAIREMMRVLGSVDALTAAARLAEDLGAAPVMPEETPGFELYRARHPLLVLQSLSEKRMVVPNDLALAPNQRVLVLTGPNTGGKTVAMKTVGLLALMARVGLHLPCDERSRMGWFDPIEVAIGDQQSIAAHLSTFAAHVALIQETLSSAGPRSLVLIDEIGADTDPMQGQALAQAILERLAETGAHTVVTTHFERLKAVPFVDPRFRNAGVGFDAARLRPTYHVTLDLPQSSSGLEIARSLGLPAPIVDRAESLLGEGTQALERLMLELQERSKALDLARIEAERAERELAEERRRYQEKSRALEDERRELRKGATEELFADVAQARAELRGIIASLQASPEVVTAREAMRAAQEAAEKVTRVEEAEAARLGEPEASDSPREKISVGDWVHIRTLGKDAEVVGLEGKEVLIQMGKLRMRVPKEVVVDPRSRRPKKEATVRVQRAPAPERSDKNKGPAVLMEELDLRGHAIDESLDRVDTFLDHHYGTNVTHVRIIHGHGTGALRNALRAHLKASGYVKSLRPGDDHEGGDGATVVELT